MIVADLTMYAGDTSPPVVLELLEDGTLLPTAGATVAFTMTPRGEEDSATPTVSAAGSVKETGVVQYEWEAGDTSDISGRFSAWFTLTFPSGTVESWPPRRYLDIRVLKT